VFFFFLLILPNRAPFFQRVACRDRNRRDFQPRVRRFVYDANTITACDLLAIRRKQAGGSPRGPKKTALDDDLYRKLIEGTVARRRGGREDSCRR